jgi:hypothetical protein
MTHADFLHFVNNDSFGYWAAILYMCGAIGALVSVALNSPPRNWVWFLIGPGIFQFLIATTEPVKGVSWRIAGKDQPMEKVWRDAETGLANTDLVKRVGIQVSRYDAPSQSYPVAWMLVFLDGLFSETADKLISWIGLQRREGDGGGDTNLFQKDTEEGPWHLLANLKWGMVENIGGAAVRDPDVRDALVTFLTSECGDQFKRGINTGAYAAAAQSRGATQADTVFVNSGTAGAGASLEGQVIFVRGLDTEIVPTPRSVVRLFNSPKKLDGSFREFSNLFKQDRAQETGRTSEIVCSEYLFTIIQALRWEAGHAYWQLARSFPKGFASQEVALKTLFYGWNIREQPQANLPDGPQLIRFTKMLIFMHLLRNELMLAPQLTETQQRFSASEQTRNFTESFVRSQGSRSKYGELYNWAIMMPHVQGILTYIILIGYPFAVMLMVIPGYWKAFFTWVTFFAWVKLWDVGFAVVHTLERSVWATLGNRSSIASVAGRILKLADESSYEVNTTCGSSSGVPTTPGADEIAPCPVPQVKEQGELELYQAWYLLDQSLLLSGALDLDLANGYYIYIMSALYFAVPAVTGQLVLGAKSGMSSIATQAISQSAGEAGGAAKSGAVGELSNRMMANKEALKQASVGKADRRSGLALQQLEYANKSMDAEAQGARISGMSTGFEAQAGALDSNQKSYGQNMRAFTAAASVVAAGAKLPAVFNAGGANTGSAQGAAGKSDSKPTIPQYLANLAGSMGNAGIAFTDNQLGQNSLHHGAQAKAFGADASWMGSRARLSGQGYNAHAQRLQAAANFERESAAYDNLNRFAADLSGMGGVAGVNPGSLLGNKPGDYLGMAMSGQLGSDAKSAARYAKDGFIGNAFEMLGRGQAAKGGLSALHYWGNGYSYGGAAELSGRNIWPAGKAGGDALVEFGTAFLSTGGSGTPVPHTSELKKQFQQSTNTMEETRKELTDALSPPPATEAPKEKNIR